MESRQYHRLVLLVHHLRPGWRGLRSPLWWVVLAGALAGVTFALWPPRGVWAGTLMRVPMATALVVLALGWHRLRATALARDWRLTGGDPRALTRAVCVPPWLLWWMSYSIVYITFNARRWLEVLDLLNVTGPVPFRLTLPGTLGLSWGGNQSDVIWMMWGEIVALATGPILLAFIAFALRWISEAILLAVARPLVGFLLTLGVALALRDLLRLGVSRFQYEVAHAIQHRWPDDWPLGARMLAGLYVGWLAYPLALTALALGARWLANRLRPRWWLRDL